MLVVSRAAGRVRLVVRRLDEFFRDEFCWTEFCRDEFCPDEEAVLSRTGHCATPGAARWCQPK